MSKKIKKQIIFLMAIGMTLSANADTTDGYYKGDVNKDGNVDIQDVAALVEVLQGKAEANARCRVDNDSDVDLDDMAELTNVILGKSQKTWVTGIEPGGSNTGQDTPKIAESKSGIIIK